MGSRFESNVNKKEVRPCRKRSKGDRLGWTPFNEVVHRPLSEVVGKIRILTDENMYRLKVVTPLL